MTECRSIGKVEALSGKMMTPICCEYHYTLSIDEDGYVWSWGVKGCGQLGHGHSDNNKSPPTRIVHFVEKQQDELLDELKAL